MPSAEVATLLVAVGALITALVGWYTAKNARKGQEDTHKIETRKVGTEEAKTLVELSTGLVTSINEELARMKATSEQERAKRQHLEEKLEEAEERIDTLMEELRKAEQRAREMQDQMIALSAELRHYRGEDRRAGTRSRAMDTEGEDGAH